MIKYVAIAAAFMLFLTTLLGVKTVDSGEVAVVASFGKVTGRVLEPGAHVIIPFVEGTLTYNTKKVTYETSTADKQKTSNADYKDFTVDTNTEDGQPVDIAYTIRFSVDPTKATWVAQNIGGQSALVEKIVKTESRIWARNIPRRFTAEELYTGQGSQDIQDEIFTQIKPIFAENGLILDTVGLREIVFTPEYVAAIQNKQVEAVKVDTAKNIALRAEEEKKATIAAAQGKAEEARLLSQTTTAISLQAEWIKKWNGVLPQTILGSEANTLIQMPR